MEYLKIDTVFYFVNDLPFGNVDNNGNYVENGDDSETVTYLEMLHNEYISPRTIVFAEKQGGIYKGGKQYSPTTEETIYDILKNLLNEEEIKQLIEDIIRESEGPQNIEKATKDNYGIVKIGNTISVYNGIISVDHNTLFSLNDVKTKVKDIIKDYLKDNPSNSEKTDLVVLLNKVFNYSSNANIKASKSQYGVVKIDDSTIKINGSGELYSTGENQQQTPHTLTVTLNGTSVGTYDGTQDKIINITTTSIDEATSSTLGGIKIGYTQNGKNYPVQLSSGKAFVNVPWTDNSVTTLVGLSDVDSNMNPNNDQVLTYDNTINMWTAKNAPSGGGGGSADLTGYATESWVQTWVGQQGFLTSFNETDPTVPSWAKASSKPSYAFSELTSHPTTIAAYGITDAYTKTECDSRFLGASATAVAATKLDTARTLWGNSFDGTTNIGTQSTPATLSYVQNISMAGYIDGVKNIEIKSIVTTQNGTTSQEGGHIDFHYNNDANDFTSRIIEDQSGRIQMDAQVYIPSSDVNTNKYLRIGDGVLQWDSTNNALKVGRVVNGSITAGNLYATGGISALGMNSGITSINQMSFENLRVINNITLPLNVNAPTGTQIRFNDNESDSINLFYNSDTYNNGNTVQYRYNQYDNVGIRGVDDSYDDSNPTWRIDPDGKAKFKKLYLNDDSYLFIENGVLKFNNNGTIHSVSLQ